MQATHTHPRLRTTADAVAGALNSQFSVFHTPHKSTHTILMHVDDIEH